MATRMYRTKQLLFFCAWVLMVVGLWAGLLVESEHDRHQSQQAAAVNASNLALAFEEHVATTVQHLDTLLLELRDEYLDGADNFEQRIRFHQDHSYNDLIIQASVIDARGIMTYSPQPLSTPPLDLSDREHFRVHLTPGVDRLFVSKPLVGRVSKKWSIQFTRKIINRDGSFGGVLVLSVDPEYFSGYFRTIDLGKDGAITLVGMDRVVRARSAAPVTSLELKGHILPADRPFFDPLRPGAGIFSATSSLDGVSRTIAYRRLRNYPLVVLVALGNRDIYAASRERKNALVHTGILTTAAITAGFLLLAWFDFEQQRLNAKLVASEDRYRLLNHSLEQRVNDEVAKNNAKQSVILQQEKLASIGQLAAGVAHEINNPMGFIMSNLGTLRTDMEAISAYVQALELECRDLSPANATGLAELHARLDLGFIMGDVLPLVQESLEGAERVKQIVLALKDFARSDEQSDQMTDLNQCIRSTVIIVRNELKYVAELELELGEIPLVPCNPQQINQVIANLLINAAHSIESRGTIWVRTCTADSKVVLTVEDTGKGMEPEVLGRIFDPFFTTKQTGKGTGLGLSISYDIITKHGGSITAVSTPGSGATLTVMLPLPEQRSS